MTNPNAYAEVLEDLRRQRDEIDVLIAGLERRAGNAAPTSRPTEINDTMYHAWQILDAAKDYLSRVKKPLTAPEIADALTRGGLTTESSNFTNTVYTTLKRDDDRGGAIIKLPARKWGLARDYPQAASPR